MNQKTQRRGDNSRGPDKVFGPGQSPISEPFRRVHRRDGIRISVEVLRLVHELGNEDKKVQIEAASKLGEVGDTNAVYSLIEAMETEDVELRNEVIVTLGMIARKNPGYDIKSALPPVSSILARALGGEDMEAKANARFLLTLMIEKEDDLAEIEKGGDEKLIADELYDILDRDESRMRELAEKFGKAVDSVTKLEGVIDQDLLHPIADLMSSLADLLSREGHPMDPKK